MDVEPQAERRGGRASICTKRSRMFHPCCTRWSARTAESGATSGRSPVPSIGRGSVAAAWNAPPRTHGRTVPVSTGSHLPRPRQGRWSSPYQLPAGPPSTRRPRLRRSCRYAPTTTPSKSCHVDIYTGGRPSGVIRPLVTGRRCGTQTKSLHCVCAARLQPPATAHVTRLATTMSVMVGPARSQSLPASHHGDPGGTPPSSGRVEAHSVEASLVEGPLELAHEPRVEALALDRLDLWYAAWRFPRPSGKPMRPKLQIDSWKHIRETHAGVAEGELLVFSRGRPGRVTAPRCRARPGPMHRRQTHQPRAARPTWTSNAPPPRTRASTRRRLPRNV